MEILFSHTRQREWDWGHCYLVPSVRFSWKDTELRVELLLLTFKLSLIWHR